MTRFHLANCVSGAKAGGKSGEKGKIFAEPTTWTGSIGVIIPHYEVSQLAEKWGIKSEPLKTGKFKDALSPFRELDAWIRGYRRLWESRLDRLAEELDRRRKARANRKEKS